MLNELLLNLVYHIEFLPGEELSFNGIAIATIVFLPF
jgi:hypothetical protein